jgi:CheY-like chemotaxis protein
LTRVTVVNDNREFLDLMDEILEDERYDATTIDGDNPDTTEAILRSRPDVLVIDLRMGSDELHGWSVAQQVRGDERFRDLPILLCSADIMALREVETELADHRRVTTLPKPFSLDQLTDAIDALVSDPARS